MNSIVQEQCVYTIVQYIYILIYVQYSYSRRIVSYTLYNSARIVSIYLSIYIYSCLVAKLCPNFLLLLWTVAHQASLSMGFPRQEYCSGLPLPSPGDLPDDPGIEPASPALADRFFTTQPLGKLYIHTHTHTHTPLHISLSRHTHTHLPIYLYLDPIVNTWFLFLSLLLSHLNISFRSHGSLPLIFQLASSKNKKFYIAIISCYM